MAHTTTKQSGRPSKPGPRSRLRKRFGVLFQLILLLLAFMAIRVYQTRNLLATEGQPAPELRLPTLAGEQVDLADLGGQPVLVYFFAPWCGVCSASADNIRRLRRMRDDEALSILVVALGWKSVDEVRAYATRHELNVPVLLGDAATQRAWQIVGFPTYYVVDGDGRIVRRDFGYSTQLGLWWRTWALPSSHVRPALSDLF